MSNAVIYTRVSTAEQADNKKSLDLQEISCRDFAARQDLEVDRVFREEGESAKTADRTQLLEMIHYCQQNKGKIRYVLVYKVDRFARRAEDHLTLKALLMKLEIQLLSATEPIENSNTGKLMETILAGFAEFDNGVRSERSGDGMRARLEEGGWVHMAPTGWHNVKDSLKRPTIAPDSEAAPKIQRLLNEFLKGIYTQEEAVLLARKYGLKNTAGTEPISGNTVHKILRSPLNAGLVHGKSLKEPIKGLHWHHRLIEPEQHYTILSILAGRQTNYLPEARAKLPWPMRRFVQCGNCNNTMTGSVSKGRTKHYAYYHCTKCVKGVRKLRKQIHAEFEAVLERVRPSANVLTLFRSIALKRWDEEFRDVQQQRRQIDDQIRECENDKNAIVKKSIKGVLDDDTVKQELDNVAIRKAELQL